MEKKTSPCSKDCPYRTIEPVNCHTTCREYLEYREWMDFYAGLRKEYHESRMVDIESANRRKKRK